MRAILALSALLPLLTLAQTEPVHPRLEYRPGLADYIPYRESERVDWRAANDTVGRLGGHLGHVATHGQGTAPQAAPGPAGAQPAGEGRGRQ